MEQNILTDSPSELLAMILQQVTYYDALTLRSVSGDIKSRVDSTRGEYDIHLTNCFPQLDSSLLAQTAQNLGLRDLIAIKCVH